MLKTLASKHRSTVMKMARKYKATIDTPDCPRKCFEVIVERGGEKKALVARFGGIRLKRQRTAAMADREPVKPNHISTTELVKRLRADCCEICGSTSRIEVHHLRKLADLKQQGRAERPVWVKLMAMRRRKTLVVCIRHKLERSMATRATLRPEPG
ncbi:HNH endonuclease [Streptomyces sp. NPDC001999]